MNGPSLEELPSLLALYLLDLRTEYEMELHALTRWQRHLEEFRMAAEEEYRRQSFVMMERQATELKNSNESIRKALEEADHQMELLRPDSLADTK